MGSGWHQLAGKDGLAYLAAIEDIKADALAIHLNPLQEAIQPEGDHDWRGVLAAIESAVDELDCPVQSGVGAGLSGDVVRRLWMA